jgi:hypothetical protein
MEKKRSIDDVGAVEGYMELFKMFGATRAAELLGWAVICGPKNGQPDGTKTLLANMKALGVSTATAYRIYGDLNKFREHVESKEGHSLPWSDVLERLRPPVPSQG